MEGGLVRYTIGHHLWTRCENMWSHSSGKREPDIAGICTMIDWQITDLCESYKGVSKPLLRLARTGFVMKRMTDLHVLIDEASATYDIPESAFLKNWRLHHKAERDWRMKVFASCLEGLLESRWGNAYELLTLLAYDFRKYSEDVYTPNEREIIGYVYEQVCNECDVCMVSVPKWFIPRHEITERNGDYLWQNVNVNVARASGGELCVYQTAIWSELNHPHVTRLLGACHVGVETFYVLEESDGITQNVLSRLHPVGAAAKLWAMNTPHQSIWELLLGIALGLQYLHERGIVCGSVSPDELLVSTTSNMANFFGGDLVLLSRVHPAMRTMSSRWHHNVTQITTMAGDVCEFGLSILTILRDITTADHVSWRTPKMITVLPDRPNYVEDDSVWHLLSKMCAANPAERVDMKYVVQQLQNIVESTLPEDHLDPPPAPDNGNDTRHPDISSDEADEMDFGGNFPDDVSSDSTSKPEDVLNISSDEAEEMKFGVRNDFKRTSKPEEVLNRLAKLAELGVFGKSSADGNAELAFVETVDEYEHPDFQSSIRVVMEEIEDQLDDIESPASPMDRHVWERLASINVYLQSLSQCRQDLLRAVIALLSSFKWSLADRVNSMSLASRTVVSRGIGHRSLAFHHSIDHLLVRFDLPGAANRVHNWKHRWDWDHQLELSNFETVLKDPGYFAGLRDEDERIEVATLLAFEISRRRAIYSADTLNAMTHAMEALRGEVAAFPVLPRWFVPWHEIEVRGYISSGSFGSVYRGKWLEADVAVKQLFQADKDDFFHEVDVWFSLNHPNVIKLFGACHVGTPFFLCEYAENGTLPKFARDQQWQDSFYQPRNPVWAALYNAAKGLHHLHRRGVIHGDLKGNNILVGADRKAKLTDFGLSVFAHNRDPQPNGPVGAVRWKAPERLRDVDNGPSFESDIFSFGMCIVELVSGRLPWINIEPDIGVREAVLQGKLPQRPPQFADDEWDLVLRMCCFDPSERIDSFSVVMILRSYVGRHA